MTLFVNCGSSKPFGYVPKGNESTIFSLRWQRYCTIINNFSYCGIFGAIKLESNCFRA